MTKKEKKLRTRLPHLKGITLLSPEERVDGEITKFEVEPHCLKVSFRISGCKSEGCRHFSFACWQFQDKGHEMRISSERKGCLVILS